MPRPFNSAPPSASDNYRVGRRIRVPEVRVIGADGSQVGILPTHEAMRLAEEQGLELVEVNPRAMPPVCKIMDFGKFKYETSKKEKASRKHQSTIVLKEIKLRPKTDDHDFNFKVNHIRRFLQEGNKCKLVVVFRGREIVHPEMGQVMLDQVVKAVNDLAMVEQRSMMEGRRMVMVIGPRGGVIRSPAPSSPPPPGGAPPPRTTGGSPAPSSASGGPSGGASGGAPPAAAAKPAAAAPPATKPAAASPPSGKPAVAASAQAPSKG
ncbi:MAG TPA: translation initiation factor IF-3 [Polyangia bacterium]|nr:translation initiation factor IF-3 [Polyangia bacterium]